jgi:hypothetical protein
MISKRHAFASLAALVLSLNLACTPKVQSKPEPIQAAVAFDTQQTMAELMLWVIDPAADTIWDSVSWISNEKGTKANAPKTEEDWKALRIQASILVESANLLMLEGRAKDQGVWMQLARNFGLEARKNLKAIEEKNVDKLFEIGGDLDHTCESCHLKYANYK